MSGDLLDNKGRGDAGWEWPAIHPEGRKYGVVVAGLSLLAAFLAWETIAWPLAFLSIGVLAFFRDPERVVLQDDSAIVSPADGTVSLIRMVEPPLDMQGADPDGTPGLPAQPMTRVSIFMSVFDVQSTEPRLPG